MNKKLFLICPDSQIELFIREEYGREVIFLTALGAVFNFQEINYVEAISDLLQAESIEEIIIVNELSCRFMKSILAKEKGFGTRTEQVMLDLYIDNYSNIMARRSLHDKKQKFAELNIQRQASEMLSNELLLSQISSAQISLKGLITAKAKGHLEEVNMDLQEIYK